MPDLPAKSPRAMAFLWFLVAAIFGIAAVVRYLRTQELAPYFIAAAAFMFIMGLIALGRSRSAGV